MKKIIVITVVVAMGWYGNYLYKQHGAAFMQQVPSTDLVKCITKDGSVIYGMIPYGTICEKTEAVKGSLTVVPSNTRSKIEDKSHSSFYSSNKKNNSVSRFKCDGRTYCSQMTSCEEATFFLKNCPGTKMDGNNDGIPCEKQWCR